MFNAPISRVLITFAVMVLLVGTTLSRPVSMAVDQVVGVYSADVSGDLSDDTSSSGDLFLSGLTPLFIALSAMLVLVGFCPRPAARSHVVHYPVQPQGPPAQI